MIEVDSLPPWYRSFPTSEKPKDARAYVSDSLPRLDDSRKLENDERLYLIRRNFVLVEWDIAFSQEDSINFNYHCLNQPDIVHVAPYKLYPPSTSLERAVWMHQRHGRYIEEGDEEADTVGFGMIYFPWWIVELFLHEFQVSHDPVKFDWFSDGHFSYWHRQKISEVIPVHWDVRPIHLHY